MSGDLSPHAVEGFAQRPDGSFRPHTAAEAERIARNRERGWLEPATHRMGADGRPVAIEAPAPSPSPVTVSAAPATIERIPALPTIPAAPPAHRMTAAEAAADLLVWAVDANGPPPGKRLEDDPAPHHPTEKERQRQKTGPGDTPKPNPGTDEKDELPDWYLDILRRGNHRAPAKQPAMPAAEGDELDAILAPGLADMRARRARGL